MSHQQQEVQATILGLAEEQVLFLRNRYKMEPQEIISLYTGRECMQATYGDAIRSVASFTAQHANKQGFIAS